MPGDEADLSAQLSGGLSAALRESLDVGRLAARLGRRAGERRSFDDVLGERPVGVEISDELEHPSRTLQQLDVTGFGFDLAAQFDGQCNGFVIRLLEPNGPGLTMQSGKARSAAEGDVWWSADVRMHVASVSKLITAIAARKALSDAGVPAGTVIYPFLPLYWQRGPDVDDLTFEMLLTHRSGFYSPVTDWSEFGDLKAQVARGALLGVPLGGAAYQNVNFGLFRILIPVVAGDINVSLMAPSGRETDHDQLWTDLAIQAYHDYVQNHVFAPAQVTGASTTSDPGNALAYTWPMPATGWDSGDLSTISAATAWHLTASEVVRLLAAFTAGAIVPSKDAWAMLEAGWGVDRGHASPAGPYFLKAGRWESAGKQVEQTVVGLLPGGLPFAVFMNSQLGSDTPLLIDIVASTVDAHIVAVA